MRSVLLLTVGLALLAGMVWMLSPQSGDGAAQRLGARPVELPEFLEARRSAELAGPESRDAGEAKLRKAVVPNDVGSALDSPTGSGVGDRVTQPALGLQGEVFDVAGRPVAGAELRAYSGLPRDELGLAPGTQRSSILALSGENGRFRIEGLEPGPWTLNVFHPAYPMRRLEGVLTRESADELSIELAEGASIAGLVQGLRDADPALLEVQARRMDEDSAAWLEMRTVTVGGDGGFRLDGLDAGGDYELLVRLLGVYGESGQRSSRVRAAAGALDVVLVYGAGAEVRWRAVDAGSGEPISGSEAHLLAVSAAGFLGGRDVEAEGPDGAGRIDSLWPRDGGEDFRLEIRAAGYVTHTNSALRLVPGQRLDLGDVRMRLGPRLLVRVVEEQTGKARAGAQVQLLEMVEAGSEDGFASAGLRPLAGPRPTDASGEVLFTLPPGVRCEVVVEQSGFAEQRTQGIEAKAGLQELIVELVQGGAARVQAFTAEGQPLAGVEIEHRLGAARTQNRAVLGMPGLRTGAEGEVMFENLAPGPHCFRFARAVSGGIVSLSLADEDLAGEGWVEAVVPPGGTVGVRLVAAPRGVLSGKLTEQGRALAGAKLSLRDPPDAPGARIKALLGWPKTTSGSDGAYVFEELEQGDKVLVVEHGSRAMAFEWSCALERPQQRLDLDLPLTKVEGRVVNEQGQPVPGARVSARSSSGRRGQIAVTLTAGSGSGSGSGAANVSVGGTADLVVMTDGEGRYSLRGVQAGRSFRVQAEYDGYVVSLSEELKLQPDQVLAGVEVALARGGAVHVVLQTPGGEPCRANILEAHFRGEGGGVDPRFQAVDSHELMLENLRPGPWDLELRWLGDEAQDAEAGPTRVEVEAGETRTLTLDG